VGGAADKVSAAPAPAKSSTPTRRSSGGGGGFWKVLLFAALVWGRYHLSQPHTASKFDPLKPAKVSAIVPMPKLSLGLPSVPVAPPAPPLGLTARSMPVRVPGLVELERISREIDANAQATRAD
jgi:hypothetical protein